MHRHDEAFGLQLLHDPFRLGTIDGVDAADRQEQHVYGPNLLNVFRGKDMAQVAQVREPEPIGFDDEDGILTSLHSFHCVVIDTHGPNVHVFEREVGRHPVRSLSFDFEPLHDLRLGSVADDRDLGVIAMQMTHQDQVGGNLMPAKRFDGVRIERHLRPLGGFKDKERLAIPRQRELWSCIDASGQQHSAKKQGTKERICPYHRMLQLNGAQRFVTVAVSGGTSGTPKGVETTGDRHALWSTSERATQPEFQPVTLPQLFSFLLSGFSFLISPLSSEASN